jgi:hypothetical protein
MKFAVEIGVDAMILIPSFTKIGFGHSKFVRGIHRHTAWSSHKPTFISQNEES